MAEPIVTGFGLTTEAAINDPAATQCAANLFSNNKKLLKLKSIY